MRKAPLAVHGTMAVLLTVLFIALWGMEIFAGDGPWLGWHRGFDFLGAYTDMYAMLLINVVLIPGMIITVLHTCTLLGLAEERPGVQQMSTLIAGLTIGVLSIVAVRFRVWDSLPGGSEHAFPPPPSDASLNYPELPLKSQDEAPWEFQDLDGKTLKLSDLKGKAVFLNFWATWCGFCKAEFPNIQKLHDALKDNPNIAFVLITQEDPDVVKKWLASGEGKDFNLPFYISKEIPEGYAPSGWPTTYILAPDGKIAFRHSGFAAWDGEKTKAFLTHLANN